MPFNFLLRKLRPVSPIDMRKHLISLGVSASLGVLIAGAMAQSGATPAQGSSAKPAASPAQAATLSGGKELLRDDGQSGGKRSMAGGGHAVKFDAPSKDCKLTGVRIFGSRYGQPTPPAEDAHVWLCDAEMKTLATFTVPYSSFARGEPKWVTVPVAPTSVPEHFMVCVGFNPTATKGVFVHHDNSASGSSFVGLPGATPKPFEKGDWLIRAVVRTSKE